MIPAARPEDSLMAAIKARAVAQGCPEPDQLYPFATGTLLSLAVELAEEDPIRRSLALDRIRGLMATGGRLVAQQGAAS